MKNQHTKNLIFLLIATLFGSTSGTLGKFIDLPPPVIIWCRCLLGGLFIYIFCLYNKVSLKIFSKKDFIKIHSKTYLFNLPFVLFHLILYSQDIRNVWINLSLTILVYIPIMIFFLFNNNYVILNPSNLKILNQIFTALPKSFQNNLNKFRILQRYFDGNEN